MLRTCFTTVLAASVAGPALGAIEDSKAPDMAGISQTDRRPADAPMRSGTFDSFGDITLQAWLSLSDLGGADNGNDCWGYTSPSGREYALMGVYNALIVVEVTNPASPSIIGSISHTGSLWADVKVYQDVAYVSNESGGGVDVIDLAQVDSGIVTLVQRLTTGGLSDVHNVAVDTDSGFLYLGIGNINGGRLVAYNLVNPRYPTHAGSMTSGNGGDALHDLQVVTYTSGQWAGRQICFGAGESRGLDIIDVTDKANMFLMSRTTYPSLTYAHQCWVSEDRHYLYLNDEVDGVAQTRVFDVQNLNSPTLLGTFGWGANSIDHNLYVKGNLLFEANYTSGLRILDLSVDPVSPPLVAYFDTYPANDGESYNGLWSTYPYFPSGTVIGSDLERGLFVWSITPPSVEAELLDPTPEMLNPAGGDSFRISATLADGATYDADASMLRWNDGNGWSENTLTIETPGNPMVLRATFGPTECGNTVNFEAIVAATDGFSITPASGTALSANDILTSFEDNCETDPGWTVSGNATDGQWTRGIPAGGGDRGDPPTDGDGSSRCWLTDNVAGNSDVDGGTTILTSPVLDASAPDSVIEYWRWYSNDFGAAPNEDVFIVRVSDDGGASWLLLEQVGPGGPEASGGWYLVQYALSSVAGLDPTDQFRITFEASDLNNGSVVEAAIDGIRLSTIDCESCAGDIDGNGTVDVEDILAAIAGFGTIYDINDILEVIAAFGTDC